MAYDKKKSMAKATQGSIDGAIATIVAIAVIGLMKKFLELSPDQETMISGAVGVIVAGAVVAVKRYVENWMKHREKPEAKPAE